MHNNSGFKSDYEKKYDLALPLFKVTPVEEAFFNVSSDWSQSQAVPSRFPPLLHNAPPL